jgi:hypothetical protein
MNAFKTSVSALALVAIAAGGIGAATLLPSSIPAQAAESTTAPAPAPATPDMQAKHQGKHWQHAHRHLGPGARPRFLEGRIAFMKAVLQITPAQEGQFNGLADALRANAKDRETTFAAFMANRGKHRTAVERMERREQVAKLRVQQQDRMLTAFKPLYAALTPDQQKVADHMFGHGHRAMHRG